MKNVHDLTINQSKLVNTITIQKEMFHKYYGKIDNIGGKKLQMYTLDKFMQ